MDSFNQPRVFSIRMKPISSTESDKRNYFDSITFNEIIEKKLHNSKIASLQMPSNQLKINNRLFPLDYVYNNNMIGERAHDNLMEETGNNIEMQCFPSKHRIDASKSNTWISALEKDKYKCQPSSQFIKRVFDKTFKIELEKQVTYRDALYGILILLIVIICSFPLTLWPQHNLIIYPQYWCEYVFNYPLTLLNFTCYTLFDSYLVMNTKSILSLNTLVSLFGFLWLILSLIYMVCNMIWIYGLFYRPPIPHFGTLIRVVNVVAFGIIFWIEHPSSLRSDASFRKRLRMYLLLRITRQFIYQGYAYSAILFEKIPIKYQFVLAFLAPLGRHASGFVQSKIADKAKGENDKGVKFAVNCNVACTHALYLAIIIGSTASNLTSILICAIDVILNIRLCVNIVKIHKQRKILGSSKIQDSLQTLVMKEVLELMLPIIYCIILALSYFGPNSDILGGIKNDYWQYEKINDIKVPLSKIGVFLAIDFSRVLIFAFVLWKLCRINFFMEYCQLMGLYWKPITSFVAIYLLTVSQNLHMKCLLIKILYLNLSFCL